MSERLKQLFEQTFNTAPVQVEQLPQSGSKRIYYRITAADGKTYIGCYNDVIPENNTFFYFTKLLHKHECNVPEVLAISNDRKFYIQEDLGSTTLFDLVLQSDNEQAVKPLFEKALEQLAKVQWLAGKEVDFNQCFSNKRFDEATIMNDLLYFKYYFLDLHQVNYNREALIEEMFNWAKELGHVEPQLLMYRDFQSRNLMVKDNQVYLIDYQGAMQGPPQYDLAALLYQARARFSKSFKDEMLNYYIHHLESLKIRFDEIYFRRVFNQFVLLRIIQTIGAYGFRGLIQHKPHFIASIEPALVQLKQVLDDVPVLLQYPEIRNVLESITKDAIIDQYRVTPEGKDGSLLIDIKSFSYKKGYPKASEEHGGGFVIDCRGILNPGRLDSYKKLSGLDKPVQNYLETQTQMPQFVESVIKLVSFNVKDYIQRDFKHLSIHFGCTGGQHRSVYAAEAVAAWLQQHYGLKVNVEHTNKDNWVK